jgi:hypothetical protein
MKNEENVESRLRRRKRERVAKLVGEGPLSDLIGLGLLDGMTISQLTRLERLLENGDFLLETTALSQLLQEAHADVPEIIEQFFQQPRASIKSICKSIRDRNRRLRIAGVFRGLRRYAVRFGMDFRFNPRRTAHPFRILYSREKGRKFHVKLERNRLAPVGRYDPEESDQGLSYYESFRKNSLPVDAAVQEFIREKKGTFVRIDETDSKSVLSHLEDFIYDPDGISVIVHNGYVFGLFGAYVSQPDMRKALPILSKIQEQLRQSSLRGKPRTTEDVGKLSHVLARIRKSERPTNIAIDLAKDKDGSVNDKKLRMEGSYVSEVQGRIRKMRDRIIESGKEEFPLQE